MRRKLFVALAAILAASFVARADTLYTIAGTYTTQSISFTLPTNPIPSSYDANTFYIDDVTVTSGSSTYVEQVGFEVDNGNFSGLYEFGLGETVQLTNGSTATGGVGYPFASTFLSFPFFSGGTNHPTLLNGSFPLAGSSLFYDPACLSDAGCNDDAPWGTLVASPSPTVTPEPSSLALLGTGLLCTVGLVRKRFAQFADF